LTGLFVGLGLAFLLSLLAAAKPTTYLTSQNALPENGQSRAVVNRGHILQTNAVEPKPLQPVPDVRPEPLVMSPPIAPTAEQPESTAPPQVATPVAAPTPPTLETAAPLTHKDMDVISYIVSTLNGEIEQGKQPRVSFTRIGGDVLDGAGAAIATARAMAAKGKRVLVIDVDRLGRGVESILGLGEGEGLSDAVSGKGSFTRIIARDPDSKVHVIRYGTSRDPNIITLIGQRLPSILQSLSQVYDLIVLHAGEAGPEVLNVLRNFPVAFLLSAQNKQAEVRVAADTLVDQGVSSVHYIEVAQQAADDIPLRSGIN
jgi:Mrp family chromosome partitioning ATPase